MSEWLVNMWTLFGKEINYFGDDSGVEGKFIVKQ